MDGAQIYNTQLAWRYLSIKLTIAIITCAAMCLASCSQAKARTMLRGVNLASGEFTARKLPGRYGYDYIYPDEAVAKPFVDAGMNAVRLPVRWERIQREPFGELSESEMQRIDASISSLSGFTSVILDVHNYARYYGEPLDASHGGAILADLWQRLAIRYSGNPKVAFGIMNEPFGVDAQVWRSIADQVILSIRSSGARNLVLVPGTRWTGGHSWTHGGQGANSIAFTGFADPADNFLYEIHQYLDADSSGTSSTCVQPAIARRRLSALTEWLRAEGQSAVLAEVGGPATPDCLKALKATLDFIETNEDAWSGWIYWAGGAWWGDYAMSIQPKNNEIRPQMAVLMDYLNPAKHSDSYPSAID